MVMNALIYVLILMFGWFTYRIGYNRGCEQAWKMLQGMVDTYMNAVYEKLKTFLKEEL